MRAYKMSEIRVERVAAYRIAVRPPVVPTANPVPSGKHEMALVCQLIGDNTVCKAYMLVAD